MSLVGLSKRLTEAEEIKQQQEREKEGTPPKTKVVIEGEKSQEQGRRSCHWRSTADASILIITTLHVPFDHG